MLIFVVIIYEIFDYVYQQKSAVFNLLRKLDNFGIEPRDKYIYDKISLTDVVKSHASYQDLNFLEICFQSLELYDEC